MDGAIFTAGTKTENAVQAMKNWQGHPEHTIYQGSRNGFAVINESLCWLFDASHWAQTSPEELCAFLAAEEDPPEPQALHSPEDGCGNPYSLEDMNHE